MIVAVIVKRNQIKEGHSILNLTEKLMFKQVTMPKSRPKIGKE